MSISTVTACRCWLLSKYTNCALLADRLLCLQAFAFREHHQNVAGFQDRRDLNPESSHLEASPREHIAHRPHLLVPDTLYLRLVQTSPAAFNRPLVNIPVIKTYQQHLLRTIIPISFHHS